MVELGLWRPPLMPSFHYIAWESAKETFRVMDIFLISTVTVSQAYTCQNWSDYTLWICAECYYLGKGSFFYSLSFLFWLYHGPCRISVLQSGTETRPWQWKPGVLTPRQPETSPLCRLLYVSYISIKLWGKNNISHQILLQGLKGPMDIILLLDKAGSFWPGRDSHRLSGCFQEVRASQVVLVVKNPSANAGVVRDTGSILGWEDSPGGGHGNPLQCSCLENPHGQKSLAGYSTWRHKQSDMAVQQSILF